MRSLWHDADDPVPWCRIAMAAFDEARKRAYYSSFRVLSRQPRLCESRLTQHGASRCKDLGTPDQSDRRNREVGPTCGG